MAVLPRARPCLPPWGPWAPGAVPQRHMPGWRGLGRGGPAPARPQTGQNTSVGQAAPAGPQEGKGALRTGQVGWVFKNYIY